MHKHQDTWNQYIVEDDLEEEEDPQEEYEKVSFLK